MYRAAVAFLACVAVLVGLGQPQATHASHSVPSPLRFWDPNNDTIPGPEPAVDASGSLWTSLLLARLDDAVADWSSGTSFDITTVGTGEQDAYVDGRDPPCVPGTGYVWPSGVIILGVVCVKEDEKPYPQSPGHTYWDIYDFDMYFHMNTAGQTSPTGG